MTAAVAVVVLYMLCTVILYGIWWALTIDRRRDDDHV